MIAFALLVTLGSVTSTSSAMGEPRALVEVADTVRPKPRPKTEPTRDRGKSPGTERGKAPPDPRGTPQAGRKKPSSPQATGDPRLKRRKPPQLHSPRKPDDAGA